MAASSKDVADGTVTEDRVWDWDDATANFVTLSCAGRSSHNNNLWNMGMVAPEVALPVAMALALGGELG